MAQIEAIVFDMDGVLIEAKEWHYEALNRALGHFGHAISRFDHMVTYDGLPTRRKLEMLTLERKFPRGLHALVNDLKQIYTMEQVHSKCRPLFQHEYALSMLHAAGYRLAVASNSIRETVDVMLSKANLTRYLEFTLSNQDVRKGKPDPEIYTTAITRLGVSSDRVLVVEDNDHGIRAATDAGAHVMIVRSVYDVTLENIQAHVQRIEEGR